MELESDTYDVVVIGTGLAESIAAAAVAKAGKSVLHLDPKEYYGAEQASLTLDELIHWSTSRVASSSSASPKAAAQSIQYTHASTSALTPSLEIDKRRYALSLFPSVLPSRGPLISTLIASDVSKYVSFRLPDSVSVWDNASGGVRRVPGSKEEVFKDKSVPLVTKRKLMKFLMFAGGEFEADPILAGKEQQPLPDFLERSFSLPPDLAQSVTYAIAHCSSSTNPTLPALVRTRRYLRSVGRYGKGAFLIGQYGGAGEVAQGFCRACAVYGGTYVLGPQAMSESIEADEVSRVSLKLPRHPRPITAKNLVSSPDHLPPSLLSPPSEDDISTTAHCIAILPTLPRVLQRGISEDHAAEEEGEERGKDDTAVILFPPEGDGQLVRALVMGEGTGSCPSGQYILYLSTTILSFISSTPSPEDLLRPYLNRLSTETLFEAFYLSHRPRLPSTSRSAGVTLLEPYHDDELLTEGLDWEAQQGEKAFWAVMGGRGEVEVEEGKGFFDRKVEEGEDPEDDGDL